MSEEKEKPQDTSSVTSIVEATKESSAKEAPEIKQQSFVFPEFPPTQMGPEGIEFDFCYGVRIKTPKELKKKIHLVITDRDSGNVMFDGPLKPDYWLNCAKKYLINYHIMFGDEETHQPIWEHDFDLKDQIVLVQMPYKGAVGDSIAWFSYVDRFQKKYGCICHVLMPPHIQALFEKQYPDLHFETFESAKELRPYASFYLGLFFKGDVDWQPYDFRLCSLTEQAGNILNIEDKSEIPPKMVFGDRVIKEPYVCIASQASSHAKHWCNPRGWRQVVKWLKEQGYRVICIDKDTEVGAEDVWHSIPYGCEDFTGDKPLQERADMIHYASAFIGLSSGLSWLAWCCNVPIVLISGICMPYGEFQTPYRVQTRHTCHGCWNDTRYEFDHKDFMWCPVHKGTARAYECTKAISHEMVINQLKRIPGLVRVEDTNERNTHLLDK